MANEVSNMAQLNPTQNASRWSRAETRRIKISQPLVISHYNNTIGGVGRMDKNAAKYRSDIRSKKWSW